MMILSIDIGGTTVKLGKVDENGHILIKTEIPTNAENNPIFETVLSAARNFIGSDKIAAIGISAMGQIDSRTGTVIGTNGKVPNYEGVCPAKLGSYFGVSASVLNDANAAAYGEYLYGAGAGCRNMLMVTFGTGIGGGIVLGGTLYEGARGIAGEIGQMVYKSGTYEEAAATSALCASYYPNPNISGRELFERVRRGEEIAVQTLDKWLDDAAAGLVSLVHIFNPEKIVLGGGISRQIDLFVLPLEKRVKKRVLPRFAENMQIIPAALGNDAGLIGAAMFAQINI